MEQQQGRFGFFEVVRINEATHVAAYPDLIEGAVIWNGALARRGNLALYRLLPGKNF